MIEVEVLGCGQRKKMYLFKKSVSLEEVLSVIGIDYEDAVVQDGEGRLLVPSTKIRDGEVIKVYRVYCYEVR